MHTQVQPFGTLSISRSSTTSQLLVSVRNRMNKRDAQCRLWVFSDPNHPRPITVNEYVRWWRVPST